MVLTYTTGCLYTSYEAGKSPHFEVITNMHLIVSLQCMTAFESGTKIFNYASYTISYPV